MKVYNMIAGTIAAVLAELSVHQGYAMYLTELTKSNQVKAFVHCVDSFNPNCMYVFTHDQAYYTYYSGWPFNFEFMGWGIPTYYIPQQFDPTWWIIVFLALAAILSVISASCFFGSYITRALMRGNRFLRQEID